MSRLTLRSAPTWPAVPPAGYVAIGVVSVQCGSALATHLFSSVGPGGAAFLRLVFGALVLGALWRPRLRRHGRELLFAVMFGIVTAAMNLAFYSALDRIPLGTAVTLEFVGPLAVAVAGSRQARDIVWVVLAGVGVILLAPWGGLNLNLAGVMLALIAGTCWAFYILLSQRVGKSFAGGTGLAIAMIAGSLALAPYGIASAGPELFRVRTLLLGLGVALLASIIPYSAELEALRHLPARVFGVMLSTEPAVAALVGLIFLGQVPELRAVVAIGLVTVAAAGSARRVEMGEP